MICDCGHGWDEHDTFRNGYGKTLVLCCHLDGLRFCGCRREVIK